MKIYHEIRKNTYYDSVTLMLISKEVKKVQDVDEALVGMGTDLNKELAKNLNIITDEIEGIGPNDFFITIGSKRESTIEEVVLEVDKLLTEKKMDSISDYKPPTLTAALNYQPESNMVIISISGEYAAEEAEKALKNNLHVMLFSDNVNIEQEKNLKELARDKGLLMMGPDCGTAIINQVPLAFANVIRKGSIGVVGASGTGTQEVTVLIHKLGQGISQVIGTGGRDLKREIGGIMMLQGIDALIKDPETKVLVLISKPPSPDVAEKVLKAVQQSPKPVVVDFIGGDYDMIKKYGAYPCNSLEDAAYKAVALVKGEKIMDFEDFSLPKEQIEEMINNEIKKLDQGQRNLRGLYTGGTLADEAMKLMSKTIPEVYSNIPLKPEYKLTDVTKSKGHTVIDLGEDSFTVGRPHPMIDPMTRIERLSKEAEDDSVAIVMMDFVLGYGSHNDPVGEMLPCIRGARETMHKKGKYLIIIASICGTNNDPQNLEYSQKQLEDEGVMVMPSNAQAVRLAVKLLEKIDRVNRGGSNESN